MPPVLKPAQAGDPEVRRPSGPDRLAVAIQNLAVPLTHSSRPRKRRDEIATSIHVSMSLALRRKGRPSAWCANPSDEIVRGPSDRVPGLSFSNRRPPQLAPAEMNRRMSGLVRSLSGFPPSGGTILRSAPTAEPTWRSAKVNDRAAALPISARSASWRVRAHAPGRLLSGCRRREFARRSGHG